MSSGLPRASLGENVRFTLTYLLPSMLRGLAIPLPFWTEVATRFDTGRGVATVERLTERYAGRPVMLQERRRADAARPGGRRCPPGPGVTRVRLRDERCREAAAVLSVRT